MQNMQDRKLAFVNGPVDRRTVSADRLANPASPYVVQAGTVIPAALITGIRSDLPGQITAQVTENVYDSPTGKYPAYPAGHAPDRPVRQPGRASGRSASCSSGIASSCRTASPSCWSASRAPTREGFAGLEDEVDYHWWDLAKAAALSTLLERRRRARLDQRRRATSSARSAAASQDIDQQHRPADRPPPAQHPADAHHPARASRCA